MQFVGLGSVQENAIRPPQLSLPHTSYKRTGLPDMLHIPLYDFDRKVVIWRTINAITPLIQQQFLFGDYHKEWFILWCSVLAGQVDTMPKPNNQRFSDIEFVNYKLTNDDRTSFLAWQEKNLPHIVRLTTDLLEAGYKLSVSPDMDNGCYIVTVTSTKHSAYNKSRAMTSKSDDWQEAIMLSLFKVFVIFDGKDWEYDAELQNWG